MAIDPNMAPKVVEFIQVASTLASRAMDKVAGYEATEKKAAEKVPGLVEHMVQTGVIDANQKQAATQMLATAEGALDLLKNASDKIAELKKLSNIKQAGDLGRGEDAAETFDPQSSLTSPFVGVRTSEKKASDVAMLRILENPGR